MSRVIGIEQGRLRRVETVLNKRGVQMLADGAIKMPSGSTILQLVEMLQMKEVETHLQRNVDRALGS